MFSIPFLFFNKKFFFFIFKQNLFFWVFFFFLGLCVCFLKPHDTSLTESLIFGHRIVN